MKSAPTFARRASETELSALRDASARAPLSEVQRTRLESMIAKELTWEEAYDIRFRMERAASAMQELREVLGG